MRQIIINKNDAGQRFDKFLSKYMINAPKSFHYKMLRKKNITLNGKRVEGNEKLTEGDIVMLYLSDDTIEQFCQVKETVIGEWDFVIIFEDANIIIVNKPAGTLSQKATKDDISLNDMIISYLLSEKKIDACDLNRFTPSICNRLDRNTSGIVTAGKSLLGLQELTRLFRERQVDKYYYCLVSGQILTKKIISAYIQKDKTKNIVKVIKAADISNKVSKINYEAIETEYEPEEVFENYTLLKVKLITGKTHQIRAHLSYIGHPVVGDYKYGSRNVNQIFKKRYGLEYQLLHAAMLIFPKMSGEFSYLSEKCFKAQMPKIFDKILMDIRE